MYFVHRAIKQAPIRRGPRSAFGAAPPRIWNELNIASHKIVMNEPIVGWLET